MTFARLLPLALALAACTPAPGDDADDTDTDAVDTDETDTEDTDTEDTDEVEASCDVDAELGTLTLDATVRSSPPDGVPRLAAVIDDAFLDDVLHIEVFGGTTTFPGAPEPGTYPLTGVDAQYATCGVCVRLHADVDPDFGLPARTDLATSGSITLTEAVDGLVGTLSDVGFEEVTIDTSTFESTPVGTCEVHLTAATFEGYLREVSCEDTVDEDGDGAVDCQDTDCVGDPNCPV